MEPATATQTDSTKLAEALDAMTSLFGEAKQEWTRVMVEIGKIGTSLESLKGNHELLTCRVLMIEDWSRKPFPAPTIRTYIDVIEKYFNGTCPCCGENRILNNAGGKDSILETDHFKGPKWNKLHDGWPICRPCHDKLTHGYLNCVFR